MTVSFEKLCHDFFVVWRFFEHFFEKEEKKNNKKKNVIQIKIMIYFNFLCQYALMQRYRIKNVQQMAM